MAPSKQATLGYVKSDQSTLGCVDMDLPPHGTRQLPVLTCRFLRGAENSSVLRVSRLSSKQNFHSQQRLQSRMRAPRRTPIQNKVRTVRLLQLWPKHVV